LLEQQLLGSMVAGYAMPQGVTQAYAMVPLEQTLTVMRQMDKVRGQLGIVYPGE